ncbi:MAG: DUF7910 domain-containing protein [Bacteroidota bacterium]
MIFRSNYKTLLLPFLLLLAGLYFVPLKIFESDFSKIPGDYGDARFNNYILEHGHLYLTGKVDTYWDASFMYPYKNVIAFSDNLLGTMPIYSIYRILGSDREKAFQFWLLTLFILNFICCYWVLNKWSGNPILSSVGAYIFSFSIFILGHIYNVQTFPRFIVPFVFYWAWKYLSQKDFKYFLFTMLGIVYQFYCGIYLGFLLAYVLLFLFIAYIAVYRDQELFLQFKKAKTSNYHLFTIILSGAILAPLILPYIEISRELEPRKFEEILSSIPTWRSYFFTTKAPLMWDILSEHGITALNNWWCHFLFIGGVPWLAIIAIPIVLLLRKVESANQKFILFITLGLILSFIFCLNINGFSLYKFVFELPGFSSMRSMNRIINTEIMFFILIFVFVFNELSKQSYIFKWLIMSFPLLVVVDNLIDPKEVMRYDIHDSKQQIEFSKEKIKEQYDAKYPAIAYIPEAANENPIVMNLNVMLAAQELNIPCVNAYTGHLPNGYIDFFNRASNEALDKWSEYNHIDKILIQRIHLGRTEKARKTIYLKAANSKYIVVDHPNRLLANKDVPSDPGKFTLILFDGNECALLSNNGNFLCAEIENKTEITATRKTVGGWETFSLIELENNTVAFKAVNNKYLSINGETLQLFANAGSIGENEKFVLISQ